MQNIQNIQNVQNSALCNKDSAQLNKSLLIIKRRSEVFNSVFTHNDTMTLFYFLELEQKTSLFKPYQIMGNSI